MTPPTDDTDVPEDRPTSADRNVTRRGVLRAVTGVAAAAAMGGVASGSSTDDRAAALDRDATDVARQAVAGPGPDPGPDGSFGLGAGVDAGAASLDPPRTLGEVWSQEFEDEVVATPFVRQGSNRIYALGVKPTGFSSTLYALEQDTGSVAWSKSVGGAPILTFRPGDAVYHSESTFALVARDASDGSVQWRNSSSFSGRSFIQPVYVAADSTVYAVTYGPTVIALDADDGTEQWRVDLGLDANPAFATTGGTASQLFVTGFTATVRQDGILTAVDRTNRTESWTRRFSHPVSSNVYVTGGNIHCAFSSQRPSGNTSILAALDTATGTEAWRDERSDDLLWGILLPSAGTDVYALPSVNPSGTSTTRGEIVRFDSGGTRTWSYNAGAMVVGASVDSGVVYASTRDGRVVSVDDSGGPSAGSEVWSTSLNAGVRDAALQQAGSVLYTGTISDPGKVYAIDANGGSVLDTYNLSGGVTGGMSVFDDRIWVSGRPAYDATTGDSTLYELGDGDGDDGSGGGNGGGGDDNGLSSFVSQYDTNPKDGTISISELNDAAQDYINDKISIAELNQVAQAYIR